MAGKKIQGLKQEFPAKRLSRCQVSGIIPLWVHVHTLTKQPISSKDFKGQKLAFLPTLLPYITTQEQVHLKHSTCCFLYAHSQLAKRFFSKYFLKILRRVWGWDLHTDYLFCNSVGFVWSSVLQVIGGISLSISSNTIELKMEHCKAHQVGGQLL